MAASLPVAVLVKLDLVGAPAASPDHDARTGYGTPFLWDSVRRSNPFPLATLLSPNMQFVSVAIDVIRTEVQNVLMMFWFLLACSSGSVAMRFSGKNATVDWRWPRSSLCSSEAPVDER